MLDSKYDTPQTQCDHAEETVWEFCEIDFELVEQAWQPAGWRNLGQGIPAEFHFVARTSGIKGKHVVATSGNWLIGWAMMHAQPSLALDPTQERLSQDQCRRVHQELVDTLLKDGWQQYNHPMHGWYNLHFKRRVK